MKQEAFPNKGEVMFKRIVASLVCFAFLTSYYQPAFAQLASLFAAGDFSVNQLPVPGSMINTTPAYIPLTLKGLVIHPENALKFDFLMDTGYSQLKGEGLSNEALKIMKYFLTALTIPEDDLWVNLSPYEKGRIIQDNFGQTIMGRDLLAQDYILKQLTASLIYPEKALGRKFWQQVYSKAAKAYGTTQIPVDTFNKVWIVPSEAVVWEHHGKVLIIKSHLKVMLEEDYLSLQKHMSIRNETDSIGANTVRQIVLPVLEKEVNEGKNFAQLRQMYQAMILATWYKKALKESILNKVYADKKKVRGIGYKNFDDIELIYQQYLKAFKKGAFNYIKEDINPLTGRSLPRKYFSGGFSLRNGLFTLATSLLVWGTTLTKAQAIDINHALENTGTTISVAGNFADISLPINKLKSDHAMSSKLMAFLFSTTVLSSFVHGQQKESFKPQNNIEHMIKTSGSVSRKLSDIIIKTEDSVRLEDKSEGGLERLSTIERRKEIKRRIEHARNFDNLLYLDDTQKPQRELEELNQYILTVRDMPRLTGEELRSFLKYLKSDSRMIKRVIVYYLQYHADTIALPGLLELLENGDDFDRLCALTALSCNRFNDGTPVLDPTYASDPTVFLEIRKSLYSSNELERLNATEAFRSSVSTDNQYAIYSFTSVVPPENLLYWNKSLLEIAGSYELDYFLYTHQEKAAFLNFMKQAFDTFDKKERDFASQILIGIGTRASLGILAEKTKTETDPELRISYMDAISKFSDLGNKADIENIFKESQDNDSREAAAVLLAHLKDTVVESYARNLFQLSGHQKKMLGFLILGMLGNKEILDDQNFVNKLLKGNQYEKIFLAQVLGNEDNYRDLQSKQKGIGMLIQLFTDAQNGAKVIDESLSSLSEIYPEYARSGIIKALHYPDFVRAASFIAANRLKNNGLVSKFIIEDILSRESVILKDTVNFKFIINYLGDMGLPSFDNALRKLYRRLTNLNELIDPDKIPVEFIQKVFKLNAEGYDFKIELHKGASGDQIITLGQGSKIGPGVRWDSQKGAYLDYAMIEQSNWIKDFSLARWYEINQHGDFYHTLQHFKNVANMAYEYAISIGLTEHQAWVLYQVGLLHDFDPDRVGNATPRVKETLRLLNKDFNRQESLDGQNNFSFLQDRLGWSKEDFFMAQAIIQRSDYPFKNEPENGLNRDISPVKKYYKLLDQIKELYPTSLPFFMQTAAAFSLFDKMSWYANMSTKEQFEKVIDGLAIEKNESAEDIMSKTYNFLSGLERPKEFRYDLQYANDNGIDIRIFSMDELFRMLPSQYGFNFRRVLISITPGNAQALSGQSDAAMLGQLQILYWKTMGNVNEIETMLLQDNKNVRLFAMNAIDKMLDKNPVRKIQIFEGVLRRGHYSYPDVYLWAKNGLVLILVQNLKRAGDKKTIEFFISKLKTYNSGIQNSVMEETYKLGISRKNKTSIFLKIFELENYEGSICREAIKFLRKMVPDSQLERRFRYHFEDKYNRLPDWVRIRINKEEAFRIFVAQGSLLIIFKQGIQQRIRTEVKKESIGVIKTETVEERRTYNRYYLENIKLAENFSSIRERNFNSNKESVSSEIIESSHSTKWVDDPAMLGFKVSTRQQTAKIQDVGGIALNSKMLDLKIERDGNGVPLPLSQQPLDRINIQGFMPQIISIKHVNLRALLGFNT